MVALVTGGDSGIGRAVAVLFAREGADVAIVYLDEQVDAEETQRCRRGGGPALPADPRRRAAIRTSAARGGGNRASFGKLDILVNNAAFQLHARARGRSPTSSWT